MIAARKARADGKEADEPAAAKGGKPAEPDKAAIANKPIGELLSSALQFRTKPKVDKPTDKPADDQAASAAATPSDPPPAPAAKPAAKKKKPEATAPVDTGKLVQDVATATATAVTQALAPTRQVQQDDKDSIESTLTSREKHELEVAKYMARTDPASHGNAPKIYLANVKQAEDYGQRWLAQNPGKAYDPDDEEHSDFFDGLKEPYSDYEFEQARAEAAAERVAARTSAKTEKRIQEVEQDAAHTDLRRASEDTVTAAFGILVKDVDESALTDLNKGGWNALAERDPILAPVLAAAVEEMQPMIHTIVEIDDPKGRIKLDLENPRHAEWGRFLIQKEAQMAGETDDHGRQFATRHQYGQMSAAQRAQHWYLTPEHLIQSYIEDTKEKVVARVKSERDRLEKTARALGYQKSGVTPAASSSAPASPPAAAPAASKPVSPSSGGGSKTDQPATASAGSTDRALKKTSEVLFGRS